jgi:hypothetical protein
MVKETFLKKMDQISVMWISIWGTLTPKEKKLLISLVKSGPQKWSPLLENVDLSRNTLSKYLDILKNKGIITFNDTTGYQIADSMLSSWIKQKKETEGYYPP